MKTILIALTAIAFFTASCTNSGQKTGSSADTTSMQQASVTYTCPMHPEVLSDKPGTCPKCKMDLVEKKTESNSTDTTDHTGHQH